jgi:hypothetical protein
MPSQARKKKRPDLVELMRADLRKHKDEFQRLSNLSKGVLRYTWLREFSEGRIVDPSMRRMILLGKFLGFRVTWKPGAHFAKFDPEAGGG